MTTTTTHGATPGQAAPHQRQFTATVASFATKGHTLQRHTRAGDARITYTVSRWDQSRMFSHWNDVLAFLTQIGGAK